MIKHSSKHPRSTAWCVYHALTTQYTSPYSSPQEDTFGLWKNICQSKLLVTVSLVLLLNKRDVLERKLEAGVRFGRYVKSYSGENRWEPIAKCESPCIKRESKT